jgi:hypothetical protein
MWSPMMMRFGLKSPYQNFALSTPFCRSKAKYVNPDSQNFFCAKPGQGRFLTQTGSAFKTQVAKRLLPDMIARAAEILWR